MKLFLAVAKKKGGFVKIRQGNNGICYCLYDENNSPVIYCRPDQWVTILRRNQGLFFHNVYENTFFIKKQKQTK